MARISTYDQDSSLNKLDKLIGTDSETDGTKNFTISSLIQLINDLTAINFFDGLSYEYSAYDNDATDPEGLMNITGSSFITTPFSGISQLIVSKKGHNSPDIENYIRALNGSSVKISEQGDIDNFGSLLHDAWIEKKALSNLITNSKINSIYDQAMNCGALGGKLLGAGGGGFLLMYMKKKDRAVFLKKNKKLVTIPFNFTSVGSQIILNQLSKDSNEN